MKRPVRNGSVPPLWENIQRMSGYFVTVPLKTSTAERKLGTHFELASGPSHLPDGPARPFGQWSQNFRCPVLVCVGASLGVLREQSAMPALVPPGVQRGRALNWRTGAGGRAAKSPIRSYRLPNSALAVASYCALRPVRVRRSAA